MADKPKTYYGAYQLLELTPDGMTGSVRRLQRDPTVAVFDPTEIGKAEVAKGRILQHPFRLLPAPPGGWDTGEWEQMRRAILNLDPTAADALVRLDERGCLRRPAQPADGFNATPHLPNTSEL